MHKSYPVTLLISLLFFHSLLQAQPYTVAVSEQPAYFVYAEASRTDGRLKVLFISSHIIRMKNSQLPGIDVDLYLDFDERVRDIPHDEMYYNNELKDIAIRKVNHQEIYGSSQKWNLNWNYYDRVNTGDNTLSALEKIRENLIREYQSNGYLVYQLDFSPKLNNGLSYNYYNKNLGKYVNWEMERVSPLSPLWIPFYKKGEIKQLLAGLSDAVPESKGYITIESKDKKEDNNTNKSNNHSGTTPKKEDHTDWAAVAAVKQMEADGYEAEGDRLSKMGTLFMMQALEKYRQAQVTSPSPRVQQKINGIESQLALAQAINKGLENMENGAENVRQTLDQSGIPRFRAGQFAYSGFATGGGKTGAGLSPWSASASYGFYRIFAMEAGLFYAQSPVYSLYLVNSNGDKVGKTINAYQRYAGISISGGLALPIKSNVLYALYGWNIPYGNLDAKGLNPEYEYPDAKKNLNVFKFQGFAKLGFHMRIPNTRIGLGVHYTLNTIKGDKIVDEDSPYSEVREGTEKYFVGGSELAKYTFNQFGVSFLVLQKKKR